MARLVELVVPSVLSENLIAELRRIDGVITIRLQRNASLLPRGDVLQVALTNRALHPAMRLLARHGLGQDGRISASTSEPLSILSTGSSDAVLGDISEATWEEIDYVMSKESNMTLNMILVMAIVGVLAVIGVTTNALHIVIGAMVIAPGFEPLTRISLGTVAGNASWRRGLSDTLKGYAALVAAAAGTGFLMPASTADTFSPSYLPPGILLEYWTSVSLPGIAVAILAALAGAMLIVTNRSVLTGGVMIALALVPTAAIAGLGLASGDPALAAKAALRWSIEAATVCAVSALLFTWKRYRVQQRASYTP